MHPLLQLTRFDKPIGIWLLYFPAAWAIALAAPAGDIGYFLLLFLIGAAVTRAAGCILNDLADRKLDAQVARTRTRPLAAGTVTIPQALALLAALLLIALAIALSLPRAVFYLALFALPMIAAYPWMKRITWWPQLFLGLTFNLSVLFGWLAVGAPLTLPAFTLYAAAILWTLGYDTIYAVQDQEDDARIGVRSSAQAVGAHLPSFIAGCYGLMLVLLISTGALMQVTYWYYTGLFLASLHMLWQIRQLPPAPARAGALFRSNQWLGLVLLVSLLLHRFIG